MADVSKLSGFNYLFALREIVTRAIAHASTVCSEDVQLLRLNQTANQAIILLARLCRETRGRASSGEGEIPDPSCPVQLNTRGRRPPVSQLGKRQTLALRTRVRVRTHGSCSRMKPLSLGLHDFVFP